MFCKSCSCFTWSAVVLAFLHYLLMLPYWQYFGPFHAAYKAPTLISNFYSTKKKLYSICKRYRFIDSTNTCLHFTKKDILKNSRTPQPPRHISFNFPMLKNGSNWYLLFHSYPKKKWIITCMTRERILYNHLMDDDYQWLRSI